MVLKTDKKNEPPFPFRQLTVVNSTHILDEDLGRTLLLAWVEFYIPVRIHYHDFIQVKRILKARVLEKAIINIKASREKDGDEILPIEEFSTILEEDNFHEKVTLTVKE